MTWQWVTVILGLTFLLLAFFTITIAIMRNVLHVEPKADDRSGAEVRAEKAP
jgi:hypothetical protein